MNMLKKPSALEHGHASRLIAGWRPKAVASVFDVEAAEERFTVEFPSDFHSLRVTFAKVVGRDDVMRVYSTNWRCEDEPNGVFDITECRRFYRILLQSGFRAF